MQDEFDFGAIGKPFGYSECRVFDGGEAHGQRLQAAESEAAIVGRHRKTKHLLRDAETLVDGVIANGDRAEQQVAVAADVFGDGLHGNVDAMSEGVEEHAGGPGVVDHNFYVARVSGGDNGWDVLNLHGD